MRIAIYLLAALLVFGVLLAKLRGTPARPGPGNHGGTSSLRPELEYLKAVNSVAPPRDPQLLFLLMAQYSNANLEGEGAEFFSSRLKEFEPRLTDAQKALYLSAIGVLSGFAAAPDQLRERHDRDAGTSQAAFRRAALRGELDRRYRICPASKPFPSEECSAGGVGLVRRER